MKYQKIFDDHMKETRETYFDTLHKLGIREVIVVECDDEKFDIPDPPYKFSGRTEYRNKFLRNRSIIEKKYFLSHKLIRNIVSKTEILKNLLLDFTKYRKLGFLELTQ